MQARDLGVGIVETSVGDDILTFLELTNLGSTPLTNHWRLYFSLGLKPLDDSLVERVIIEGRYGYLQPAPGWSALGAGESRQIPVEEWLFSGITLIARQGFYLAELVDDELSLLGEPVLQPPRLVPLTRPRNRLLRQLSPSARLISSHTPPAPARRQREVIPAAEEFAAGSTSLLVFDGLNIQAEDLRNEAARLQDVLNRADIGKGSTPCRLTIDRTQHHDYAIDIDESGIEITGRSNRDVFYGIQTLRQYLSVDDAGRCHLPRLQLLDTADFEHRGLAIDIARHFQPMSWLKKIIEAMAGYKLNRLQLGISNDEGWRLEIVGIPSLTQVGSRRSARVHNPDGSRRALYPAWGDNHEDKEGYLSANDFIELLQFADSRHVEVILELNMPGHARAMIASLEGTGWKVTDPEDESTYVSGQGYRHNVVNVGCDDTYRLLHHLLREIKAMYTAAGVPFHRVHLGGDEVAEGAWLKSPACRQLACWNDDWDVSRDEDAAAATAALTHYHLCRATAVAREIAPGIEIGFWHEMAPHGAKLANTYYTTWVTERGQQEVVDDLMARSQSIVICNASYLYLDMPYVMAADEPGLPWASYIDTETIYRFDPLKTWGIPDDKSHLVAGIQAQLWTETVYTPDLADYYLFPRLLAVAERAWNRTPIGADWPGFARDILDREMDYLKRLGIKPRDRL